MSITTIIDLRAYPLANQLWEQVYVLAAEMYDLLDDINKPDEATLRAVMLRRRQPCVGYEQIRRGVGNLRGKVRDFHDNGIRDKRIIVSLDETPRGTRMAWVDGKHRATFLLVTGEPEIPAQCRMPLTIPLDPLAAYPPREK